MKNISDSRGIATAEDTFRPLIDAIADAVAERLRPAARDYDSLTHLAPGIRSQRDARA